MILAAVVGQARANNDIFPASTPAAASAVSWKDGYFSINGKPTFLTSGEMHYARIPRDLWRDRIWRSRQMGFNTMQMYVFWNASEPKEGQWDFTDNLDLDAWLSLVQEMGMYAVVRVGPYSCAEWDDGGLPPWLLAKPGMTLRDGGAFAEAAAKHLEQVEKIVARHQIHKGGNVIMVQLENEHPRGWGTDVGFPYLKQMVEQARANGLEIPLFLSGLHHGAEPSGESPFKVGASPWYSTEFWTGWIGKYGDMDPGMLAEKIRGTWKIIAFGGGGYDYYMVHGGTNFGYAGHSPETTYDYAAPIGETGRFNNFYWPARRAAYFAQSFSSLLTASHDDPALASKIAGGLRVTARTSPTGGSFVLLDAFTQKNKARQDTWVAPDASAYHAPAPDAAGKITMRATVAGEQLPEHGTFTVTPNEPHTLLLNFPWTENATFTAVSTNVMFHQKLGQTDYWVCYGQPNDSGEIVIARKTRTDLPTHIEFTYPAITYPGDASVKEINIDSGDGQQAKLLVMNTDLTQKTWLADGKLYIGPSFVLDTGKMEFDRDGGHATIYTADGKSEVTQAPFKPAEVPTLGEWTWRDAAGESAVDVKIDAKMDGDRWAQSQGPQEMASYDDFTNRYGWYRTMLHCDKAGPVSLHFAGEAGKFLVFLNGRPASFDKLDANAGDNTLAILAKADPRPTLYNYIGPIGNYVARGLWGGVSTDANPTILAASWKRGTVEENKPFVAEQAMPDVDSSKWQAIDTSREKRIGLDKGTVWLRGTFDVAPGEVDSILSLSGFGNAEVTRYLNGKLLAGSSAGAGTLLKPGENVLLLRVNSRRAATSGGSEVSLWHNSALSRANWFFHGGLSGLDETAVIGRVTNWDTFLAQPWKSGPPVSADRPTLWHTTFSAHRDVNTVQTLGLTTDGLKSGHIWLNGHNLGECPEKVLVYMPECWIKDGVNDLIVFDMYGSKPEQMKINAYQTFALKAEK